MRQDRRHPHQRVEAFFDSGFLNAGMPLEIASIPVRAVQPDAKARSSRKTVSGSVPSWCAVPAALPSARVGQHAQQADADQEHERNDEP